MHVAAVRGNKFLAVRRGRISERRFGAAAGDAVSACAVGNGDTAGAGDRGGASDGSRSHGGRKHDPDLSAVYTGGDPALQPSCPRTSRCRGRLGAEKWVPPRRRCQRQGTATESSQECRRCGLLATGFPSRSGAFSESHLRIEAASVAGFACAS